MFQRILVANRGEIALRIIRACREMGIETVAVYSTADRGASYLDLADQAICIGPPQSSGSYLDINKIISAAENADFAEICRDCKIEFIGPHHDAMAKLGDKVSAKAIAQSAGVHLVPGSDGLLTSEQDAVAVAEKIGYPVLIKATAGGGGKGM